MSRMLRTPSLGPIVGHTTPHTVRVWMRGAESGEARTVGVAVLYRGRRVHKSTVRYFRLHREFDRTGWIDFEELKPDTEYRVRLASLTVDDVDVMTNDSDDMVFDKLGDPGVWLAELDLLPETEAEARFRTPADSPGDIAFVFGSCRYPGFLWQQKRADRIFGAIRNHFTNRDGSVTPEFFMMVGDQIYADMLNRKVPLARADTEEEFRDRYLGAFGAPNTRDLLRSVPTYMILDDHEIEDNWVQGRVREDVKRGLFNIAIGAYRSYQWLYSPRNYGDHRLFYSFEWRARPFFVLDGRTQRMRDDEDRSLDDNHMLGFPRQDHHEPGYRGQIDVLCDWLVEQQQAIGNRPKFIVSPSVFVPNDVDSVDEGKRWRSDSWPAFPKTRGQLLNAIVKHRVQNVVFLSGDIHVSCVARLRFLDAGHQELPLRAFSVVSSAFYWPFPFADGDPLSFVHDSVIEGDGFDLDDGVTLHYRAWNFEQDDNYTRVDVSDTALGVRHFDRKGNALGEAVTLELVAP